jgi:DNA polymerase-1
LHSPSAFPFRREHQHGTHVSESPDLKHYPQGIDTLAPPSPEATDVAQTSTLPSEAPTALPAKQSKKQTTAPVVEVGPTYDPGEYLYIKDASHLAQVLPALLAAPTAAIDTETTGLDPLTDRLRTLQIATEDHTVVVDLFRCPVAMLAPLMDGARWLIGHHLKFDLQFLAQAGLPWPSGPCFDTMLGAQVLGANTSHPARGRYSLEGMAQDFLQVHLNKSLQQSAWDGELSPEQVRYAAADAAVLLPLAKTLRAALREARLWKVAELEGACVRALAWLELAGMPVDAEQWRAQAELHEQHQRELAAALSALAGVEINWNSPPQLLAVLHDRGLPVTGTAKDVLIPYIADEFVAKLFEYRRAANRAQTYGERWLRHLHLGTGRVHADFIQLGSGPGRMSCKKPNLQNIPREAAYRKLFRAPEGCRLVKADYSQIELRLAAIIAPDEVMLQAYCAATADDLHIQTAAALLGLPTDQVTQEHRQLAKAVNFGLLYGMGAPKLQEYAWEEFGVRLSEAEAYQHRTRWLELYPGIRQWHQSVGQRVERRRSIETRTLYGRQRMGITYVPDALNSPVQGSGADGVKLALVRLFEHRNDVPHARLINAVHDEVLAECPTEEAEETAAWLKTHMETAMQEVVKGQVPTPVEIHIGQSWGG